MIFMAWLRPDADNLRRGEQDALGRYILEGPVTWHVERRWAPTSV